MIRAGALSLAAALCSCAIDDRTVEVSPACVSPPADGRISDFPTARLGRCSEITCPGALAYSTTVSLGDGGVKGLAYSYEKPDSVVLALGLTGDLGRVSDDASALRVVVSYDSLARAVPTVVGGFAVELIDCVTTAGYTGIGFRTDGELGGCPLRFAAHIIDSGRGSGTSSAPCPLDDCFADTATAVTAGLNEVSFPVPGGDQPTSALVGMQWELGLPADGARTCAADFTLDDLRLLPAP